MRSAILAALLCAGCGGAATSYAAVGGACEAAEAALELECDSDGRDCTGELTTEEYRAAVQCTRRACDAIQRRIEEGAE